MATSAPIVCVVDDDEPVRRALCMQLERAGFATVGAANGLEGLRTIRSSNAAVAVVDILMPDHGLGMIGELKKLCPSTRILAISGGGILAGTDYLKLARDTGADETLTKPFRQDEFIKLVRLLAAQQPL